MNTLLHEANEKLALKQKELQDVVDKVQALKQKCEGTLAEKTSLDSKTQQAEKRLERAQKLTAGLATEEVRWAKDADEIGLKLVELVGNAVISAACVSYFGPFTGSYPRGAGVPLAQVVPGAHSDLARLHTGHHAGQPRGDPQLPDQRPADELRHPGEVRAALLAADRPAKRWIKNEHRSKLLLTKFSSKDMLKMVETAVKQGLPLDNTDTLM